MHTNRLLFLVPRIQLSPVFRWLYQFPLTIITSGFMCRIFYENNEWGFGLILYMPLVFFLHGRIKECFLCAELSAPPPTPHSIPCCYAHLRGGNGKGIPVQPSALLLTNSVSSFEAFLEARPSGLLLTATSTRVRNRWELFPRVEASNSKNKMKKQTQRGSDENVLRCRVKALLCVVGRSWCIVEVWIGGGQSYLVGLWHPGMSCRCRKAVMSRR